MMNQTILIGRLVKDPEMRMTQGGTAVTKFTLAVDRSLSKEKKKEAEEKGYPTADFIPIEVWGKLAETCAKYLSKGKRAAVQGNINTGSYEKDGVRVYTTNVRANEVKFLDWGDSQQKPQAQEPPMDPRFESAKDDPFPF